MPKKTSKWGLWCQIVDFIRKFGYRNSEIDIIYSEGLDLEKLIIFIDPEENEIEDKMEEYITKESFDEIYQFYNDLGNYIKQIEIVLDEKVDKEKRMWDTPARPMTPTSHNMEKI